jgi:hypothetical protein
MSYTIELKTTKENLEVEILDMKGKSWRITSKEYTTVTFSYTDNSFTIASSNGNETDSEYREVFSIESISDAFWMILAMTASGFFEFKRNEPVEILRRVL